MQAEQIVQAGRRLSDERGDQFTTQELAKEAGVAVQTFYRYFESKDQLLLAVLEDMMTESCGRYAAESRRFRDPMDRLHYFVSAAVASLDRRSGDDHTRARFLVSQHWRLHELFPDELARAIEPYQALVAEALRDAVAEGEVEVDDVDVTASFIARLVRSTCHDYAFATADVDVPGITEQVWSFCLHGVRTS